MFCRRLNTLSGAFTISLALLVVSLKANAFNPFTLSQELDRKLKERAFLPSTEYYVASEWLKLNALGSGPQIHPRLLELQYQERNRDHLRPGEFFSLPGSVCQEKMQLATEPSECYRIHEFLWGNFQSSENLLVATQTQDGTRYQIVGLWNESLEKKETAWALKPVILAQTVGSQPIMQKMTSLSGIPAACMQAVLAIEDTAFLEHAGVSITGTFRAFIKNIISGRKAQGGSTITQQLVKNYFLTPERTYKRKIQEMILSFLLESQYTKDEILEIYLNIIYMAQNGPYQVLGFPSAAEYYFSKPIEALDVHECALLAAILNGPGVYNPFKYPDKALNRRNLVLNKMYEQNFITEKQHEISKALALPSRPPVMASETSPYFLESARSQLNDLGISLENVKILLTLDLEAQSEAQKALQGHLQNLESQNAYIKKQKEAEKKLLEGLVLSADQQGRILVAVGGRNFKSSQFNRVIKSRRQIGSLIKPFVYLTAIEKEDRTPLDMITDEKFVYGEGRQKWSPENYDKKFIGQVPLYFALKSSLNAATAKLGIQTGLESIIDTMKAAGVEAEIKPLPSLTLGAVELPPLQVLHSYLTLSQIGKSPTITFIEGAWDHEQNQLYRRVEIEPSQYLSASATAITVGMMKQAMISGTAASAGIQGLKDTWAGKTGTTSDNKDTWFAGFNRYETTVVWVGYDNNTATKLTGSSGAVPIWTQYTKWSQNHWPKEDFAWPEKVEEKVITQDELLKKDFHLETQPELKLIFKKTGLFGF